MLAVIAFVVCGLVGWGGCWWALDLGFGDSEWGLLVGLGVGSVAAAVGWLTYGVLTLLFE